MAGVEAVKLVRKTIKGKNKEVKIFLGDEEIKLVCAEWTLDYDVPVWYLRLWLKIKKSWRCKKWLKS
jgi:hypothetical protein